jgi:hypothetical protein
MKGIARAVIKALSLEAESEEICEEKIPVSIVNQLERQMPHGGED